MESSAPTRQQAKFARSLLTRTLKVRPGENVTIEGWSHSLPWAIALARETRRLKAFPLVLYEDEDAYWDSIDHHEDQVLGAAPAHEWAALGKTDVYIHMWGAGDRVRLDALPGGRADKLFGWNGSWYEAARKAGLRGARLEIGRPFPSLARAYGVDLDTWTNQVVEASMVDPRTLRAAAAPIAKALEKGRRIRVHDDRGTDLTLGLLHRPAAVATGEVTPEDRKRPFRMLSGIPSGGVMVSLDETVADGTFVANRSCYYDAAVATGGRFEFKNGRLVGHRFAKGGELFEAGYKAGGKGRDRPGRLRIGLNPKLHNTPQVEDVEAGAVLVSVGGNGPDGKNTSPFFGFLVNVGARVEIDGRPLRLPG